MPRLYHRKSTTGCIRCKRRRVKCGEQRPKCSDCERHQVECEYSSVRRSPGAASPQRQLSQTCQNGLPAGELRLLHNFLLNTSGSFNNISDYWRFRASMAAYTFRPFFDGILALSALHLYRQAQVAIMNESAGSQYDFRLFLPDSTPDEMYRKSRHYLHRAIKGVRESLVDDKDRDYEPLIVGSSLITINAMFLLAENDSNDDEASQFNEELWLRLGAGPRELSLQWLQMTQQNQLSILGIKGIKPDVTDMDELFSSEALEPFLPLMQWCAGYEYLNDEDQDAYMKTMAYLGVIYAAIRDHTETPLATARRFNCFPSRAPSRFVELALEKRPRAMVVLAHAFALMKLLARDVHWFDGIAEKQIPAIQERLPLGWRAPMQWPLEVLEMEMHSEAMIPEPTSLVKMREASHSELATLVVPRREGFMSWTQLR